MQETVDAAALKEEGARGDFGDCLVEGPISLDLATDREAAAIKGYHSPVAEDADIFLVPNITAGNLLGKSLYGLAGGDMAGWCWGVGAHHHQLTGRYPRGEVRFHPHRRRMAR